MPTTASHRRGQILLKLLGLLLVLTTLIVAGSYVVLRPPARPTESNVLLHRVRHAEFESFITEDGFIESADNVEIRCRVKARNTGGTAILEIVPEGSEVAAGDFLIRFDDSHLIEELTAVKIVVATDKAAVIQAQSDLATAEKTLREFEQGTFEQERELLQSEVFVAEENLRRSRAYLNFSSRLAARGYLPSIELEADRFAVEKAEKDVAAARRKLMVYEQFTGDKLLGEYRAGIAKQQATLEAAQETLKLSEQKLAETEKQIANCTVTAPSAGIVVYGNDTDRRGDDRVIIEEGMLVREGQVVILLPDPQNMQVDTTINEARINQVRAGNPVKITLDSEPDVQVQGDVRQVNKFPYPQRWFGGPIEYGATVQIRDFPDTVTLRPGLRCKVHVYIHREDNVLQAPITSVFEHQGSHYCLLMDDNQWRLKAVTVGPNNEKFVIIRDGLSAGDRVAVNPQRHLDQVELPEATPANDSPDHLTRASQAKLGPT